MTIMKEISIENIFENNQSKMELLEIKVQLKNQNNLVFYTDGSIMNIGKETCSLTFGFIQKQGTERNIVVKYFAKKLQSSGFFIGTALAYTRLEEENDAIQDFNVIVFYPIGQSKSCFIPKLKKGQVLSIANSRFAKGANSKLM
ncbi:hypothetical protein C1645_841236 [Glomus cerebriforme]|uniref:Uncharacterized protein n=1 Tax=Glomus cerebriforme TaxID=658196 RepID=A0A397S5E7_9GLOM|nr:hypothetical protein C1645_841236 [Glomus cerebriforme]